MGDRSEVQLQSRPQDSNQADCLSLLDLQIKRHEHQEKREGQLSRVVNWAASFVCSEDEKSLAALKKLRTDLAESRKEGDAARESRLTAQVNDAIAADRSALGWRADVGHYGSGLLKTGALFFPGAAGRLAATALYGLDGARKGEKLSEQVLDGGLAGLKGYLTHSLLSSISAASVGVAGRGVLVGTASRGLEMVLDRHTYSDAHRSFNLSSGLSRIGSQLSDPVNWLVDGATFVVAHGLTRGVNKISGGMIENSRFLSTALTGTGFGLTAGALSEVERQRQSGEKLDLGKVVTRALVQGGFDTLAALPGAAAGDPAVMNSARNTLSRTFHLLRSEPALSSLPAIDSSSVARIGGSRRTAKIVEGYRAAPGESVKAELAAGPSKTEQNTPVHDRLGVSDKSAVKPPSQDTVRATSALEMDLAATAKLSTRMEDVTSGSDPQTNRAAEGGSSDSLSGKDARAEANERASKAEAHESGQYEAACQPGRNQCISDETLADGSRVIVKADGLKVTIQPSGKVLIEYPPDHPKLIAERKAELARLAKEAEKKGPPLERKRHESPDFSHLPLAERPVNVGSSRADLIEREMSNFEHSPFVLDGREFASVEGFYVWLKWSGDPARQAQAAQMWGSEAKKFGKPSTNKTAEYNGQTIVLGGPEHHALIKRAIQAKLEQHPDLARRFAETHPRKLLHDLGYPEPPSRLPAADFTRILTELRQDLVDGKIVTADGPVSNLSEQAKLKEASRVTYPVSDVLRSWLGDPVVGRHPIDRYAAALEGLEHRVTRLFAAGADALSFEMANGNVFKVTCRTLGDKFGNRPFDLHVVERGVRQSGGLNVYYFVQPKGETTVSHSEYMAFTADLKKRGYMMADGTEEQLVRYNGAVKLADPFAVEKL
jgi:predicted NAD-dependent protein-ADP-ribosyltransferase YbiA (DUF1768 family)